MGVATKIGEIAKKRKIPLKELSRRADIPYTTLYNAVKRDSKIDIETARKIRKYSEVPIAFVTAHLSYSLEGYKVSKAYSNMDGICLCGFCSI